MSWSRFTREEDAEILRLRDKRKWSFTAIATLLRMKPQAVYNRYRTLKAVQVSGASLKRTPPSGW